MGNRAEWLIADFAILKLGAVMVSINTWATRRELAYQLRHSDTSVLITQAAFLGHEYPEMVRDIRAAGETLPALAHVVVLDGGAEDLTWEAVTNGDAKPPGTVAIRPDDIAYILYTSGSTSTPKGVQLVHERLIDNMWDIGERMHIRADDRLWLAVSLYWGLGCENALFAVMTHGAAIILQESFKPGAALALIEAERCILLYATPNMVRALLDDPDFATRDICSLRAGGTIGTGSRSPSSPTTSVPTRYLTSTASPKATATPPFRMRTIRWRWAWPASGARCRASICGSSIPRPSGAADGCDRRNPPEGQRHARLLQGR